MSTIDSAYKNLKNTKAKLQDNLNTLKDQQAAIQKSIMDVCLTMIGLDRAMDAWEDHLTPTEESLDEASMAALEKDTNSEAA